MSSERSKAAVQMMRWYRGLVETYNTRLTEEELKSLAQYEASPNFTCTSDWPGWEKHLGPPPFSVPKKSQTERKAGLQLKRRAG